MNSKHLQHNPSYIHHQSSHFVDNVKEIVFGLQDGMVSTLGAITGIAIGSANHFIIILSGIAIIAVESISMGIGSYTSTRSEKKLMQRILDEEHEEIHQYPTEEAEELHDLFVQDGWTNGLADQMVKEAAGNKKLMLREMMYRELNIAPDGQQHPIRNGLVMFLSYIAGGLIPLSAYFFFNMDIAINISIFITLLGLFGLGAGISKLTKEKWYSTGMHMFVFGGTALVVGYFVGVMARNFLM